MSFACIFHVCLFLGLSKEKKDLGNISFCQDKFFVVHTLEIVCIGNITTNPNRLREIAELLLDWF